MVTIEINLKSIENKAEKARLEKWIAEEINGKEYTEKEINALCKLVKQGKKEAAWKILLKGHKCPVSCYCQKEVKTWKEKMSKAQLLLELAEREGKEAEKLRIRETAHLFAQRFKQHE